MDSGVHLFLNWSVDWFWTEVYLVLNWRVIIVLKTHFSLKTAQN